MSDNETIIEVVTFDSERNRIDRAEALTPEDALFAARTLHDEAFDARGRYAKISVAFLVDDELVRWVDGRP